jgi:hypothetical protein
MEVTFRGISLGRLVDMVKSRRCFLEELPGFFLKIISKTPV